MSILEEIQLVERAKTDPDAFAELYRAYVEQIFQYLAYRVSNQAEAEDLTSQVWEKVLKSIKYFNPESTYSFKAWLYRIAKNSLIDYYRKNSKSETIPLENAYSLSDKRILPSEMASNKQILDQLKTLIKGLPKKQAQVLNLRIFGELTNKEIAETLKTSEKTVASNFCRGLSKVHEQFSKI